MELKKGFCPACGENHFIVREKTKVFTLPNKREVVVKLYSNVCQACGATVTTREQRARNLEALAARREAYGEWMTGEEVLALRKRYGITQTQAAEIFGKGKIAFSRYENESSYPDLTMSRVMRLAFADPKVMAGLASAAGVELPLLEKRLTAAMAYAMLKRTPTRKKLGASVAVTRISTRFLPTRSWMLARATAKTSAPSQSAAIADIEVNAGLVSVANDERFALAA